MWTSGGEKKKRKIYKEKYNNQVIKKRKMFIKDLKQDITGGSSFS